MREPGLRIKSLCSSGGEQRVTICPGTSLLIISSGSNVQVALETSAAQSANASVPTWTADKVALFQRRRAEGYDLPRHVAPDYFKWLDVQVALETSAAQSADVPASVAASAGLALASPVQAVYLVVETTPEPAVKPAAISGPVQTAADAATEGATRSLLSSSVLRAPTSCRDIMRLRMQGLRQLRKDFNIPYQGRVSRRDLCLLICDHFHLSTAGEGVPDEEADKPALPEPVMAAYKKLPSFSHIASSWSVSRLTKIPFFTTEAVKHYLLNSPDTDYDKESLQCYRQLRAYQLFDEHHLHKLEGNLFAG